ncbi:hypothetical protein [Chachezhania sediminis]|uniref:hypothetical protein n=1 Tax=Chachezhania sediminis TaxID=2599291 RepID=UPI00131DF07E|nr:hypothetical protein [Chachezhania sediminis]
MKIVFHAGAHFTQSDRLMKCLLRNSEDFAERRVAVPGPARYRSLFKTIFQAPPDADPAPDTREILIDAVLDDDEVERVILSNEHFFGAFGSALGSGRFYPDAPRRIELLCGIFRPDDVEMVLAVRNPATFLPEIRAQMIHRNTAHDMLAGTDPLALRWSDTIRRIRRTAPNMPITIWCNEDAPLIWPQVLRRIAGYGRDEKIVGGLEALSDVMTVEGLKRLRAYVRLLDNPSADRIRQLMLAFLEKYSVEDLMEEEIDMPGWTDDTIETLTQFYDEDMEVMQQLPGVTVLFP